MTLARMTMLATAAVAAGAIAGGAVTPARAAGDAAAGKIVFAKCLVCHTTEPGKWKIGPSLFGVVGRHSASEPGFAYSQAMKNYNVTWTPETLDHYLQAPMKVVPGTHMIFPGLPSETDRQNVIAYLETLK